MNHHPMHEKRIDHLKAMAIILVVFYHALFEVHIAYAGLPNICLTIALEHVHVPLFILISGYLCHKQEIRGFFRKKVFRILIPFLFFTVLKLLVSNLAEPEFLHANSLPTQLWDAFVCGQLYWFCYCLMILYLIAPLLWDRKILQWIVLAALIAANVLLSADGAELTNILQLQSVVYYSPFFVTGMLLSGYAFPGSYKAGSFGMRISLVVCVAALAVTGYLRFVVDVGDGSYLTDLVFGLSVMYFLYLLTGATVNVRWLDRILSFLGRYSLQIMLLDPFWRMGVYALFSRFLPDGMLLAVLVTLPDLALSGVTCLLLRRIPVLSFLTGLKQLTGLQKEC